MCVCVCVCVCVCGVVCVHACVWCAVCLSVFVCVDRSVWMLWDINYGTTSQVCAMLRTNTYFVCVAPFVWVWLWLCW